MIMKQSIETRAVRIIFIETVSYIKELVEVYSYCNKVAKYSIRFKSNMPQKLSRGILPERMLDIVWEIYFDKYIFRHSLLAEI